MSRLPAIALMTLCLAPLAWGETRVYRCEDAGRVTYADFPCTNARAVTVDGGTAAPDARERLKRNQDELDQRAAARRDAVARDAALAHMQVGPPVSDAPAPEAPAYDPVYDFAYAPLGTLNDRTRGATRRPHVAHRDDEEVRNKRRRSVITQPPPTPLRAGQR
jgi:hypothetical protein